MINLRRKRISCKKDLVDFLLTVDLHFEDLEALLSIEFSMVDSAGVTHWWSDQKSREDSYLTVLENC